MACSASEIYAARSSIVGSIGVIGGGFGFVEVAEKIGVRTVLQPKVVWIQKYYFPGGEKGFHSWEV